MSIAAAALMFGTFMQVDVPPMTDPASPPPPPVKVTLTTGEVLEAPLLEETPGSYRLAHPVLGEIVLARESVSSLEVPSTEPAPPKGPWTGSFSLAVAGYENVNSNLELRVGGELKRKTDEDELRIAARYFFGVTNSVTNDNNFQATIDYKWFIPDSKWFVFGTGQAEYDEFQSWEKRLSAWGGVGYKFRRTEAFDLTGRLGAGVSYEFGPPSRLLPEVLAGIEAEYRFSDAMKMTGYFTIFPDVAEIGEFRFDTGIKFTAKISGMDGLAFEAGLSDQYQSQIESGTRNDFRYFAGLKYEF